MKKLTIALMLIAASLVLSTNLAAKGNAAIYAAKVSAIEVNASNVKSLALSVKEQPESIMFHKKNVLTVSVLNDSETKLVLRIKNDANNTVYSSRSKEVMYHQRLSTKNMKPGEYQAELLKGKKEIEKLKFTVM